jgi:hypothetical protein
VAGLPPTLDFEESLKENIKVVNTSRSGNSYKDIEIIGCLDGLDLTSRGLDLSRAFINGGGRIAKFWMLWGAGKNKKFKISTVHAKISSKSMMLGVARALLVTPCLCHWNPWHELRLQTSQELVI